MPLSLGEVDADLSAWAADPCGKSLDQGLLPEEEREPVAQVRAAGGSKFKVFLPVTSGALSKDAVDSRRVTTWEIAGGERDMKASCVASGI